MQTQRFSLKIGQGLLALALFMLWDTTPAITQGKTETLYSRLGGYDAIAAVVDDFIGRLGSDPQFARFINGFSRESKKRRRQLIVDQLCEAAGGPCFYIGRSMKASHEGLEITETEWAAMVKHLAGSLDKFKIPQKEKEELLAIVSSLKADIVEVPEQRETARRNIMLNWFEELKQRVPTGDN